ncbi:MAG: oxidoreductase [Thermodesulfobacteriota bacterium]|nr:oxidoreductase [Thermodesulfobacteriota bacterium]
MRLSGSFINNLYTNLSALSRSAFPKRCNNCGEVFETEADFIQKTRALDNHSGLKSSVDDDDQSIVELYRNCTCGSTLLDFFNDRRDLSEKGLNRRETFGRIMSMLEKKGIPREQARQELLKFMRGQHSRVLEKMGIRLKKPGR